MAEDARNGGPRRARQLLLDTPEGISIAADLLNVSRLQRRLLLTVVMLAVGLPIVEHVIAGKVASPATLVVVGGTNGPFGWTADAPGAAQSIFKPGDTVSWLSQLDVTPGTSMISEITLWCGGREISLESTRLLPSQTRSGWKAGSMRLPMDARGACEIRRRLTLWTETGHTEEVELPAKIVFEVAPP